MRRLLFSVAVLIATAWARSIRKHSTPRAAAAGRDTGNGRLGPCGNTSRSARPCQQLGPMPVHNDPRPVRVARADHHTKHAEMQFLRLADAVVVDRPSFNAA